LAAPSSNGYDANGDLIEALDPNGNRTQYHYDDRHQILSVVDPRGPHLVSNTYDADRRVVTYQTDAQGQPRPSYAYQELDRVTTITDALDGVTVHHHDELLRPDPRGRRPPAGSDSTTTTRPANRIAVTDPQGNTTRYVYDARGNVIRKTDALDNITEITYDADDNPLSRTDALGKVTQFSYDANGNLIQSTRCAGQRQHHQLRRPRPAADRHRSQGQTHHPQLRRRGQPHPGDRRPRQPDGYSYDSVGRRLTATDALGRVTGYAYDANDNLLSITDALAGWLPTPMTPTTTSSPPPTASAAPPSGSLTRRTW
jgi:YD repeat-containing protein